jgi:hypothetical protein
MEGGVRSNPGQIIVLVGQSVDRECFRCGMEAGHAQSERPATVLQKWICVSCGTLNQFEIKFRDPSR